MVFAKVGIQQQFIARVGDIGHNDNVEGADVILCI